MKLLRDEEIVSKLQSTMPPICNFRAPVDWYAKESPVQASSVDLHIGHIHLPTATGRIAALKRRFLGTEIPTYSQYVLEAGHTAVIVTEEKLAMPDDLAAIGFPPSNVSFQGILMTNPGHVDAGYKGHMRFAIINMGKTQYVLRRGDPVVTLLLFELDQPVKKDWLSRQPQATSKPDPSFEDLSRLSTQFLDIDNRARAVSKKLVTDAEWKIRVWTPLLAGLVGALLTGILAFSERLITTNPVDDLKHEIIEIREQVNTQDFDNRLEDLERKVNGNRVNAK